MSCWSHSEGLIPFLCDSTGKTASVSGEGPSSLSPKLKMKLQWLTSPVSELSNLFELWDCSFCTFRADPCPKEKVFSGEQITHTFRNTLLESRIWMMLTLKNRPNHSINSFLRLECSFEKGAMRCDAFPWAKRCNCSYLFLARICSWEGFRAVEELLLLCESEVPFLWIPCIPSRFCVIDSQPVYSGLYKTHTPCGGKLNRFCQ